MNKRLFVGFSLLEVTYWCFQAAFIGFMGAYLLSRGISSTLLSLLTACYMLAAVTGSFVWGSLCDFFHTRKKFIIIGLVCSAVCMYFLYFLSANTIFVFLLYPLLGFCFPPLGADIDAWLLDACHHDLSVYGKIRAMPSFFYAFVAAVGGQLISIHGYDLMLGGGTFFAAFAILTVFLLPESEVLAPPPKKPRLLRKIPLKNYLCRKNIGI